MLIRVLHMFKEPFSFGYGEFQGRTYYFGLKIALCSSCMYVAINAVLLHGILIFLFGYCSSI